MRRYSVREQCSEMYLKPIQTLVLTNFSKISILDTLLGSQYALEIVTEIFSLDISKEEEKLSKIEFRVSQNNIEVINTRANELSSLENVL